MLNSILAITVVLVFVAGALLLAKLFIWVVFWLASLAPQVGRRHRHDQWGRDLARRTRRSSD